VAIVFEIAIAIDAFAAQLFAMPIKLKFMRGASGQLCHR
jgi:hypothetical protein